MIPKSRLQDAELIVRYLMAVILLTAATSKWFSDGGFADYYAGAFQAEGLRISLPAPLVYFYLHLIPYIETAVGLA